MVLSFVAREGFVWLTSWFFLQLGDLTQTKRNTHLLVFNLYSGVAMIALGYVRLFEAAAWLLLLRKANMYFNSFCCAGFEILTLCEGVWVLT